jgi:hypothetical protein
VAGGHARDHDPGAVLQDSEEKSRQRRARKPASKKSWPRVKDLDFRPKGKQPLREFVAGKQPGSFYEKNLVAVAYLEEVLAIPAVGVGEVLAAYDECGWKPPTDPQNSLHQTSSHRKWLDTADMKAIRLTHRGRSMIQYDMPTKKSQPSE